MKLIIAILWLISTNLWASEVNSSVMFNDFKSDVVLAMPPNDAKAVVVLVHGSGPWDKDSTMFNQATRQIQSKLFKEISDYLTQHNIAVVRYNKRHVSGPGQINFQRFYQEATIANLAEDLTTVVNFVKGDTNTADLPLFLYGWSEGAITVSEVAKKLNVNGVILQGTPIEVKETFAYQREQILLPWLSANAKSKVTISEIMQLSSKGNLQSIWLGFSLDMSKGFANISLNPYFDTNNDNALDIEQEWLKTHRNFANNNPEPFKGLAHRTEQIENLPVLILQGELDGNTPKTFTKTWVDGIKATNISYHEFSGLGHSLGKVENIAEDLFPSIEQEPLKVVAHWLNSQVNKETK